MVALQLLLEADQVEAVVAQGLEVQHFLEVPGLQVKAMLAAQTMEIHHTGVVAVAVQVLLEQRVEA
jgi:hypothetical protein